MPTFAASVLTGFARDLFVAAGLPAAATPVGANGPRGPG